MERPHSRKKTVVEGTAVVKKGEKLEGSSPSSATVDAGADKKREEKKEDND